MLDESPIDRIYKELSDAINALREYGQLSAIVAIEDHARKALLLSAASHFEHRLTGHLIQLCGMAKNPLLTEFAVNKVVSRQYHSLFQWESKNANSFFGLFGQKFLTRTKNAVKADTRLENAIRAFLELGFLRNQLVHKDYATYPLEKTSDEIYSLYQSALHFVNSFPEWLNEFVISDGEQASASVAVVPVAIPQQQD